MPDDAAFAGHLIRESERLGVMGGGTLVQCLGKIGLPSGELGETAPKLQGSRGTTLVRPRDRPDSERLREQCPRWEASY